MANRKRSLETILTFDDRDRQSDWSVVWSTGHIPGMDTATGRPGRRAAGRRRLRIAALTLGACLTMHCRVAAYALSGGFFIFMLFLVPSVAVLANPLRHFEVYLGQWSISGPGRAFRIIPMLDGYYIFDNMSEIVPLGIGIAICINAIVRAICSCTVAAIAAIYVVHSVSDDQLPFTYCRGFDLTPYEPIFKEIEAIRLTNRAGSLRSYNKVLTRNLSSTTVGTIPFAWRNTSRVSQMQNNIEKNGTKRKIAVCKETYSGSYPVIYRTPPYNFFYVEVVHVRSDFSFGEINGWLIISIVVVWTVLWFIMITEKISYGRLIWNNMYVGFTIIPWVWSAVLMVTAITSFLATKKSFNKMFRLDAKEVLVAACDAMEVALLIHAASTGTELVHGKGLNYFASGHIDPHLNGENVWHSSLLVLLTTLNAGGAAICAFVDLPPDATGFSNMLGSTLWILPMYSTCSSIGNYSHLQSTLIFAGLMFSHMTVAFVFIKTALHTIFEYRVKLVFVEQFVLGGLILICMGLSVLFATNGGLALLESIDSAMTGLSTPFICLLELIGLLCLYESHDFVSDINIATEENTCSTRIGLQWQIIPFVTLMVLVMKMIVIFTTELPNEFLYYSVIPLAAVALSVPIRTIVNMYAFMHPSPRRGI